MALMRWGGVGIFAIYWLLGQSNLRDDIFSFLPASIESEEEREEREKSGVELGQERYTYVGAGTEDRPVG